MRRGMTIAGVLVAGVLLAGCGGDPADPADDSPSPSSTNGQPTVEPTATSGAEIDEPLLPIPVDDISAWAATAVPGGDSPGHEAGMSGWLSQHTSPRQVSNFRSLEPGPFQAQLACRGDGTITLTASELSGEEPAAEPVVCSNETIAFDVATVGRGLAVLMELEGAPTIYAFSLHRVE